MQDKLMEGFPPAAGTQVTLANWRAAPFTRWSFHHVREVVPSADIANDPWRVAALPRAEAPLGLEKLMEETDTDALVVLHHGKVVFERYAGGTTEETPHILMSVSKAMLGLLAGILAGRGMLDVAHRVTDVLPEMRGTAYEGATLRQLLDMRAGIGFAEDYLATSGPIIEYRKATNWHPLGPGEKPSDLRSFFATLKEKSREHGGHFDYISPNTDLLGWVIERATGRRYADLMSELLWKPLGAERPAYITVDRLGAPRCAGGVCMTARDLARVGQMFVDGGRGIVPAAWLDDIVAGGDAAAWSAGSFAKDVFPGLPMRYRAKWYVVDGESPLAFGWGIHGQHLFVDRKRQVVVAKFSSQVQPVDVPKMALTIRSVSQLAARLSAQFSG